MHYVRQIKTQTQKATASIAVSRFHQIVSLWRRALPLLLLLSGLGLWQQQAPVVAQVQSQTAHYWQHQASGRLRHLITADINHDSIDEFLIVDENGKTDLISANGVLQWSYPAQEPVLAINTVNIYGPEQPDRQIILGLRNRLILLSNRGEVIWQRRIAPISIPLALLTGSGGEAAENWLRQSPALPVAVMGYDRANNGSDQILVLLESGQLQLYDTSGALLWRYARGSSPQVNTQPKVAVGDVNGDGQNEIVLGIYLPRRFSQIALLDGNGFARWDQPVTGRITTLSLVTFAGKTEPYIAVGNNLGHVNLYTKERQRAWLRTLNKPITSMAVVQLPEGPALAVGTSAGTVVTYNSEGRRLWTRNLGDMQADQSVLALSAIAFTPPDNQPVLSAILAARAGRAEPSDVVLLSGSGRVLDTFAGVDTTGLTRLTDINGDRNSELLLTRFATLELVGLSIGSSETAKEWEYRLDAVPLSSLAVDFDQDGEDELLVGTDDGRIHRLGNDGRYRWVIDPGGSITHLAVLANAPEPAHIIAVRTKSTAVNGTEEFESWLELRRANGEQIWEQRLPTQIKSLLVDNVNNRGESEIIIGTLTGEVIAYTNTGSRLWQEAIGEPVEELFFLRATETHAAALIAVSQNALFKIDHHNPMETITRLATFQERHITNLHALSQPGDELATALLVLVDDGSARGLVRRGIQLPVWPLDLGGTAVATLPVREEITEAFDEVGTSQAFLIATDARELLRLNIGNNRPTVAWRIPSAGDITSLFWGDLDGDAQPDLAIGDERGTVRIYTAGTREPHFVDELDVFSSVFDITVLGRRGEQKSDLLVITKNGLVQLFRAQENRPPLLTNPSASISQGQYSASVSVRDVERKEVRVWLEIHDPETQSWVSQGEKIIANGNGEPFWLVADPLADLLQVQYRFFYDDGFHQGYVTPPPGPAPIPLPPPPDSRGGLIFLVVTGFVVTIAILYQTQLPTLRARRFYLQLNQQPDVSLVLLERKYSRAGGSPDYLLNLASQARQRGDPLIAGLADGLFLLADRPHAALPILISALDEIGQQPSHWQAIHRWQMTYKTGQALLEAPSITELSLLRPQLVQLLVLLEERDQWAPVLDALLPILTNLRDSDRVDLAEDRLVYLNEAAILLKQLQEQLPEFSDTIEKTMASAIAKRWSGLVTAEIEELRGRAELVVTLKTRRLMPSDCTDLALEIRNSGRAAAENVVALLAEDPAYQVYNSPEPIPFLPPGRTHQIGFTIKPMVADRFRIALTLIYDDRHQKNKTAAFGDMVSLLPPVREFKPIPNPYLPGSPLRRGSSVFYGREELFEFIGENIGRTLQQKVLILVGQRRTGKTSVLLRLEEHLPDFLLPVYIDCQSLGVTPGMPALLHDLAWYIADALAGRDINIEVPEPAAWQEDPTGRFQRHFLPQMRALLPQDTVLLLVFDEFEAFESLVNDGILPPTFFTYMRHLMQHSQGISFVFVGTQRLEEMSADYWSVLFNIALYKKIGYLGPESATRLICEPVAPNLIYDDLAIDKILRVTDGHPYFLQLVCYTLVKRANSQRTPYVTISDVNAACDEMLRLGEVHFAYLWQRSTHNERALLTAISHLMDRQVSFHPEDLVQYLEVYGIRIAPTEVTAALNRLVERDIMRDVAEGAKTLYELKIGLVGLWVAQHKSLSKLYASNGEGQEASQKRQVARVG